MLRRHTTTTLVFAAAATLSGKVSPKMSFTQLSTGVFTPQLQMSQLRFCTNNNNNTSNEQSPQHSSTVSPPPASMKHQVKLKVKSTTRSLLDPFLAAVRDGQTNRVRHLLEVGSMAGCPYHSPAYIEDPLGNTALHYAAHHGMDEIAFMLVAAGAEVGHCNDFGHTAENVAQQKGNTSLRSFLSGANTLQLGMERACEYGDNKFVDYLINDAGAAPTKAAALAAVKNGHEDLAERLTRQIHGFDQPLLPLQQAAVAGDLEAVSALLTGSGNRAVDVVRNKDNRTALHFAAEHGHVEVVSALILAGAQVSPSACMDGLTPLHWACKGGHLECVKKLLSSGANKDQVGLDGITPLHIAAHGGHREMVELLLAIGAPADAMLEDGSKPLDLARTGGHMEVASVLMRLATNAHWDLWNEPCDVRICATSEEPERFEDAEKEKYEQGKELISRMCLTTTNKPITATPTTVSKRALSAAVQQRLIASKKRSKKISL